MGLAFTRAERLQIPLELPLFVITNLPPGPLTFKPTGE